MKVPPMELSFLGTKVLWYESSMNRYTVYCMFLQHFFLACFPRKIISAVKIHGR